MLNSIKNDWNSMRGSGLTKLGSAWFVIMFLMCKPFIALYEWSHPLDEKKDFSKFKE